MGKTRLAVALAIEAVRAWREVRYVDRLHVKQLFAVSVNLIFTSFANQTRR